MEFLSKIENLINAFIMKLGELMMNLVRRYTPSVLKRIYDRGLEWSHYVITNFKSLPKILKELVFKWIKEGRSALTAIDFRAKLNETYKIALAQYKSKSSKSVSAAKSLVMSPILLLGQWLQGLSTTQSVLLLTFSAASVLAGINIIFSGQRLMGKHFLDNARTPASIEEELKYERPEYYKEPTRHLEVTNFRLPVYFGEVNEVKSVDIDFYATVSNRQSRIFLEKHEFQLRDHLIIHLEPLMATFPLEEEGKEILRQKIWTEINEFLKQNNIEGQVEDLKVTYILAN